MKLEPGHAEEYIEFLKSRELWNEAALRLAGVVNDDMFVSLAGKSKHMLWLELCDLITRHPGDVSGLPVDAILRGGIAKFTDEQGRLWTSLADFHIRRGVFEKARDVYEEGLGSVVTVRDFSLVFDAYSQFEESLLAAKMEAAAEAGVGEAPPPGSDAEAEAAADDFLLTDTGDDIDLRLARLEALMSRRPELLSGVMLRQNPHSVAEWLKRVALFAEADPRRAVLTFAQAVKAVDPAKAVGRPGALWTAFARFYEDRGDVDSARTVFAKAIAADFKTVDDLASVWCEWAEMELRAKNYASALDLMRKATSVPPRVAAAVPASAAAPGADALIVAKPGGGGGNKRRKGGGGGKPAPAAPEEGPASSRLHKSLKLWSFYVDLEESLGTLDGAKKAYDSMLSLRVATPQTVLNYAALLTEAKAWEAAFGVYERGAAAFSFPHCKDIWVAYLQLFNDRFGGRKLERARDLHEQAIAAFPPKERKPLYLAYAALEETHGLLRHAMDIYARACADAPEADKLALYDLYVSKAMDAFGVPKVRSVLQGAIDAEPPLSDGLTRQLAVKFAALECKMGELDRARILYAHAAQFSNPAKEPGFWEEWNSFEVRHGNEDTFREMLRVKRSIAANFQNVSFGASLAEMIASGAASGSAAAAAAAAAAAGAGAGAGGGGGTHPLLAAGMDPMGALDAVQQQQQQQQQQAAAAATIASSGLRGFVSAGVTGGSAPPPPAAAVVEEIELADEQAEEEEEADTVVTQQAVPDSVFGDLAAAAAAENKPFATEALGALERFKRQKLA